MKSYKAVIELKSPLATPMMGDTVFGHVCWGIVRRRGEEELDKFLSGCAGSEPPHFAVSSAFPHGRLPRPLMKQSEQTDKSLAVYSQRKELKAKKYIPADLILDNKKIEPAALEEALRKEPVRFTSAEVRTRNTINRVTGTTGDEGSLFPTTETHYHQPLADLYIVADCSGDEVSQYLDWAFEFGFGADASVGMGQIGRIRLEEIELPRDGKWGMSLGPFIPSYRDSDELEELSYEIFVRYGKLGGGSAASTNPFKKPLVMFTEGSTFIPKEKKETVGTLIGGVHSDPRIRHSGIAPVVYFDVSEEVL